MKKSGIPNQIKMHKTPLFISGIGRSGTSAVISSLAKHKEVVEPDRIGEAPIISHFIKFLIDYEDTSPDRVYHLKNYQLDSAGRDEAFSNLLSSLQYGFDVNKKNESEKFWIAKVSLSETAYKKACELFKELRVIYVMRNGIEVVNSARSFHGFTHLSFEQLCKRWVSNIEQCRYVFSSDLCAIIRHDELVIDPFKVYQDVYTKLKIEHDTAPAEFISTTLFNSSFDKSAAVKSTANVFNNRLACWDDWNKDDQRTFFNICDGLMDEFDFQRPYIEPFIAKQVPVIETLRPKTSLTHQDTNSLLRDIAKSHMLLGQLDYYANVSEKHKYLFIENPKVASTSLLKFLQEQEDSKNASAMANPHVRDSSPLMRLSEFSSEQQETFFTSDEYFRFAFVRNPLTRLLSAYLSKIAKPLNPKAEILAIIKGLKTSEITDLKEEIDFPTFVEAVCSQKSAKMNAHWRGQVDQIMYNEFDYSFIGYFENLEADYETMTSRLFPGTSFQLGQSKNKTASQSKYNNFYTPALIDMVYNKFYDDFNAFGYDKLQILSESA